MEARSAASFVMALALVWTGLAASDLVSIGLPWTGVAWAQDATYAGSGFPLRVEWQSRSMSGGRTVVSGYVYNTHEMRVQDVRLRVETLDAASRPIGTRVAYVTGTIGHGDRAYFDVAVPSGGTTYRVNVESFDWAGCGNG